MRPSLACPSRSMRLTMVSLLALWGSNLVAQQATPAARPVAGPAATATVAWTTINYLNGGSVYLEVGTKQGIREGSPLEVMRGGTVIAHLAAQYVSSNRTACTIASGTIALALGDSVRFHPIQEAATAFNPNKSTAPAAARRRPSPIRGRVGLRYLVTQQPDGGSLNQPAMDLRLDGSRVGGSAFGLAVDVRTQRTAISGRTSTSPAPSPVGLTRVYQAAITVQPGKEAQTRLALGRQFATTLSPIGIFDGAALDLTFNRWSLGALAGAQPDPATFAPSSATTEYGVWIQRHSSPRSPTPWSATVGAIGSYDHGTINREFGYLRATYSSRRFSLYAAQEIDANRGWKREVEGSATTFTSSFATAQLNVGEALSMSAGVDSRRSVRLYRDFLNPEIVFDDIFRQGSWGDVSLRFSSRVRLTADARRSAGGPEGRADAVTASLYANRLTKLQLGLRVRTTKYTGPLSEGMLTSASLEAAPSNAFHVTLNAGQRTTAPPDGSTPVTKLTWTGADLDVALGRSVYLQLSTYRESGTASASIQSYGSFSWRF